MKNWTMLAACALALAGCEALADAESQGPAIATMRGTLSLAPGMQPPGELRLSILWRGPGADSEDGEGVCGPNVRYHDETPVLEQSLDLDTDFPAAFSVKLTEPPPPGVLHPFPGTDEAAKAAMGSVVVYRDVNGNGRLDLRGFDQPSVDIVIGSGHGTTVMRGPDEVDISIVYLTEDMKRDLGYGTRKAGYSLVVDSLDPAGVHPRRSQPLNDQAYIELELDDTRYVQRFTCEETCAVEDASYCPANLADLPPIQEQGVPGGDAASWHLESTDGDQTTFFSASCRRGNDGVTAGPPREQYFVSRWTQQGCKETLSNCIYERSDLPEGAELPCTEYQYGVF